MSNVEELKMKIDILEKLLSKEELARISVSKRFFRIRKKLSKYLSTNI